MEQEPDPDDTVVDAAAAGWMEEDHDEEAQDEGEEEEEVEEEEEEAEGGAFGATHHAQLEAAEAMKAVEPWETALRGERSIASPGAADLPRHATVGHGKRTRTEADADDESPLPVPAGPAAADLREDARRLMPPPPPRLPAAALGDGVPLPAAAAAVPDEPLPPSSPLPPGTVCQLQWRPAAPTAAQLLASLAQHRLPEVGVRCALLHGTTAALRPALTASCCPLRAGAVPHGAVFGPR